MPDLRYKIAAELAAVELVDEKDLRELSLALELGFSADVILCSSEIERWSGVFFEFLREWLSEDAASGIPETTNYRRAYQGTLDPKLSRLYHHRQYVETRPSPRRDSCF